MNLLKLLELKALGTAPITCKLNADCAVCTGAQCYQLVYIGCQFCYLNLFDVKAERRYLSRTLQMDYADFILRLW